MRHAGGIGMKLAFITKGSQNPRGKSKIYFCGHPADYGAPFRQIAEDILGTPNCVIWYDTEPETDRNEEQYLSGLSEMQLFVIPVTPAFLNEENRAFKKELPFAVQNHIPVLPVMEDNRLEHIFEQKCGNMQSLKRISRGPEAMPYKERLKQFLSQILISNEMTLEILSSFQAGIFLAYRKEDRGYAHRFMMEVHKNPRFRKLSVWYDEFLNIGNDYSEEIDAAIIESNVFAMTVTPHILTNGAYNYVKEREYPLAVSLGKQIIPVEFEETDPNLLAKDYTGIPAAIHIEDSQGLYNALESAFACCGLSAETGDLRSQYLLGLAYLGGIGLERNPEYAASYITSAAEAGYPDAMGRLSSMYYYGEAVSRDLPAAIRWQERFIQYYEDDYEKTATRESGIHMIFEQHKLYGYYLEAGQDQKAFPLCVRMKKFSSGLRQKHPRDYSSIECLIISISDMSDFLYKHNDIKNARKLRLMLLPLTKMLAFETGLPDAKEDLSINYQQLGSVAEEKGDFRSALKYYKKSLFLNEKNKNENGTDSVYLRWIDDLYRVGHCHLSLGQPEKAETYLKKCRKEYAALPDSLPELWRTYDALSAVYCQKHDLENAMLYCDKGIRTAEQIQTIKGQRNLADSYSRKADILTEAKQYKDAGACYTHALDIMRQIFKKTGEYKDQERLWNTYGMFGDYYFALGKTAEAKENYAKGMEELISRPENSRKQKAALDLAQMHQRMGFAAHREGDYASAKTHFTDSLAILNKVRKKSSDPSIPLLLHLSQAALKELERV